jgi:hypothetical protein
VEYNQWKEKVVEKKRNDEGDYEFLNECSSKFNMHTMNNVSSIPPKINNQPAAFHQQFNAPKNDGSLSFTSPDPNYTLPNNSMKNTTFDIPQPHRQRK